MESAWIGVGLSKPEGVNPLEESRMEVELGKTHIYGCTFRLRTGKARNTR